MPRKSDKAKIDNKELDRRVKLTDEQRLEIAENEDNLSQRALARKYGVSRRLISFILFPEKLKENLKRRQERGGTKAYYDKDKHREYIQNHRLYKKELYDKGLISEPKEENKNES